ncbi:MAG: PTS glucose transporter subunit IIA [Butyrivibrio sp.]|nr:PTS glucose transporter subunit IIA [Butyrivibrio sp.]
MGIFDSLFKGKSIEICAPVKGQAVSITKVSDPTFAQEMVGKGIAIEPSEGKFYAPCDGQLVALFPTGHAFCMLSDDGAEVLVHIGIDTVKLKGEHFTIHATQGQSVKKGDLIVEADLEKIKEAGYETITPVIVSNPTKFSNIEKKDGAIAAGDPVILLKK